MNYKGFRRKQSWPIWGTILISFSGGSERIYKNLNWNVRRLGWDTNRVLFQYKIYRYATPLGLSVIPFRYVVSVWDSAELFVSTKVVTTLSLWLYNHLDLGLFLCFLILYTVGSTPWTGDQHIARPLPTHRTAQTQTFMSLVGAPLHSNKSYSIVACVFTSTGICLPSRYLAINVYSGHYSGFRASCQNIVILTEIFVIFLSSPKQIIDE
jgi:hypothetical protein